MFAPFIEWAADNGIVKGISADKFAPNEKISREQMAAIICRYAEYAGIKLPDDNAQITFTDESSISAYAVDYVRTLQMAGVINGFGNGDGTYSYHPNAHATREQACKVLCMI